MRDLIAGDYLVLIAVGVSWLGLAFYFWLLFKWRRKDKALGHFIAGAPLWFVKPSEYFVEGRTGAPWKGLLLWFVGSMVLGALVNQATY